jgi:hypothetical protein
MRLDGGLDAADQWAEDGDRGSDDASSGFGCGPNGGLDGSRYKYISRCLWIELRL